MDGVTQESTEEEGREQSAASAVNGDAMMQWARNNLALFGSLVLALLTIIRLMRVSHGEPLSARALLRYGGTTNVVLSALFDMVPMVLAFVAAAWIAALAKRRRSIAYFSQVLPLLMLSLLLAPVGLFIAGGLGGAVYGANLGAGDARWRDSIRSLSALLLVPLIFTAVVTDTVWLPSEEFQAESGSEVGYVIKADSEEIVVMSHDDREIRILESASVTERRICSMRGRGWFNSLFENRIFDYLSAAGEERPRYRSCPTR